MHIIAGRRHRIGKEVDRRWEEGDVLEAARLRPIEYERASRRTAESLVEPGLYLSRLVKEIGIRKLNRQGLWEADFREDQSSTARESFHIAGLPEWNRAIRAPDNNN